MATATLSKGSKETIFEWEGKDKNGKIVRGEMRAGGEAVVNASHLHAAACHHDESWRALAAVL